MDSVQPLATAEEEALRRNTDCVYYLASPLTCKKGSECEYRHSEAARINPRDCWFWMNGNCLNPKCAFRHPPLDGLIGTAGAAPSVGLPIPPSYNVGSQVPPGHPPAYSLGKQSAPCYYFQKGLCLKGDRCYFMHGPQPISNLSPQQQAPKASTTVSESQNPKKTFGDLQRCTQQQTAQENISKTVEVPPPPKQVMKTETSLPKNGVVKRNIRPFNALDDECPQFVTTNAPIGGRNSVLGPQHSREVRTFDDRQNGKVVDEFLRESSPGFDVLVDDEVSDSKYYQTENEYRRTASHEERHLTSRNDFDYDGSVDYAPVAKYDREPYDDPCGYDPHGQMQDQYALEQRRASSERISERSSLPEKRGYPRVERLDHIDESDLRHRLSKQRRVNGSRLAVSPDRRGDVHWRDDRDRHIQDQRNRGHSWRDSRHIAHESYRSNRLHSRLTLPGRSSPERNHNDSHPEREMDRGRNHGRLSPGRPSISPQQGRHQDRIKWRGQDDFREARNTRGGPGRRDGPDNNTFDFTGPKSLAELKNAKVSESSEARHTKVRQVSPLKEQRKSKIGKLVGHQDSEGSLSFKGPKPLSEILKRKRGADTASSGDSTFSRNGDVDSPKESGEIIIDNSRMSAVAEIDSVWTSEPEKEANHKTLGSKEEHWSSNADLVKAAEDIGQISTEGDDVVHKGDSLDAQRGTELETEDGMLADNAMEDQEFEKFDNRDGEYDYEQADGEDVENLDAEEDYFDDEDGDDFAKRIGVMFS